MYVLYYDEYGDYVVLTEGYFNGGCTSDIDEATKFKSLNEAVYYIHKIQSYYNYPISIHKVIWKDTIKCNIEEVG